MEKIFTLILILLFSPSCFSQNIVPNGSFEDTVTCPIGIGEINLALGWNSYRETPDYLNACNTSTNGTDQAGVPHNFFGYQAARTGQAYAGFYAFTKNGQNIREIIGVQLIQSLTVGLKYFLSFYVSNASDSILQINMGVNKLGARFTTKEYSYLSPIPIDNNAQIYTDSVIADTLNWVKISGSFIADSAYSFIAIGDFFIDDSIKYTYIKPNGAFAYYYIDDVRLSTDSNYVNAINEYHSPNPITSFPNPARDWIEIRGNDIQSLVLYDVLGRIIYINSTVISPMIINVSSFPKGIYYLEARTKNTNGTQKLIIN